MTIDIHCLVGLNFEAWQLQTNYNIEVDHGLRNFPRRNPLTTRGNVPKFEQDFLSIRNMLTRPLDDHSTVSW